MPQKASEIRMDKARPSSFQWTKKRYSAFLRLTNHLTPAISPLWMNSAMPSASRSRLTWLWLRRCGFWYRHPTQQRDGRFCCSARVPNAFSSGCRRMRSPRKLLIQHDANNCENGRLRMATGFPGSTIISTVLQVLSTC